MLVDDLLLVFTPTNAAAIDCAPQIPILDPAGPVIAVDMDQALSNTAVREQFEAVAERRGYKIRRWLDVGALAQQDGRAGTEAEAALLDWLAEMPDRPLPGGGSLKRAFTLRDELSLWWLTPLSQRKAVKTPVQRLFATYFRMRTLMEAVSGPDGLQGSTCRLLTWGAEPLLYPVLTAAAREIDARLPVSLESLALRQDDTPSLGWLRLFRRLVGAYLRIIRTALWLRRLRRDEPEPITRTSTSVVTFAFELNDFREVPERQTLDNFYLPLLDATLAENGIGNRWIVLDGNRFLDPKAYREVAERLPTSNGALYPGLGIIASLLLSNLSWIWAYWRVFSARGAGEAFVWNGVDFTELVRNDFRNLCFGHAATLLYQRACFMAAWRRLKPQAVLYHKYFNTIGRIVAASAIPGTKMLGLQHGIVNNLQIGGRFRSTEVDVRLAAQADHVATCPVPDILVAFGQRMVDFMRDTGYPGDKVKAVGSLRHDLVVGRYLVRSADGLIKRTELLASCRHELGLPDDRPVVLLCTQWKDVAGDWLQLMAAAFERLPEPMLLVVKPHPQMPGTRPVVEAAARAIGFDEYRFVDGDLAKLAFCADVAVTHSSTSGIEAILLQTPLIAIVQRGLYNDNSLYTESPGVFTAATAPEMVEALDAALSLNKNGGRTAWEAARREFLSYHLANLDAPAIGRMVELIRTGAD